jgi:N-acetylneuraminate synthase
MLEEIIINKTKIGTQYPPYIIAEMSANHNGRLENALKIIQKAKDSGANAVKIQTYHPDKITLNSNLPDFKITSGLWAGKTLYELYQDAYTPWEWHKPMFEFAKEIGITIFSSPFDFSAVDLLESLNTPAYKIASFEIIDLPLIKYVAKTGKPLIISTGMANFTEITEAICAAKEAGCKEIAILHCVSGYPAPEKDYHLKTIPNLRSQFNLVTGLSDHTTTNVTAIASIALGASIIEKHFTLDKNGGGADDSFSIEPEQLLELCKASRIAWESLGDINYSTKPSENENIKFRRSLYYIKEMKKGDTIQSDSIRSIRPGYGVAPKFLDKFIGQKLLHDVHVGMPVKLGDIDPLT